jgi:hypothetical protein
VTIELDDHYVTPAAQLSLLWMYNWRSLLGYLENALYGIRGMVKNADSKAPVAARVFITGHDKDSSHVYSDSFSGGFVRLLAPGSWTLTFSATGYYDISVPDIIVTSGQKTDIIVDMIPIINSVDTTNPETPFLYPNPATTEIKAVLPYGILGNMNVKIISQSGKIMSDFNTVVIQGVPLPIDVRTLSGGSYSVVFTNRVTKISYYARFIVIK